MKLRKGDRVRVLQGKDRGKEGVITKVFPTSGRVIIDGGVHPINVAKKHQKSRSATRPGGIIDKFMPLPASSVAILCPQDGPTRIGYRMTEDPAGPSKVRICRKCGGDL
jgi:large subunit ribosomal protein L24